MQACDSKLLKHGQRIGRSKMQRTALGFPYAVNLEMDNSLK